MVRSYSHRFMMFHTLYTFSGKIESKRLSQYESMRFLNVSELFHPVCFPARFLQKRINPYRSITFHHGRVWIETSA